MKYFAPERVDIQAVSRGSPPVTFYTSVGGGALTRRLLQELSRGGNSAKEFSVLDDANYRATGGFFNKLGRRWKMYGEFGFRIGWRRSAGVRIVTTNPFFAPALVSRVHRGNGITINLVYDLFPEALEVAGIVPSGGRAAKMIGAVTRYAMHECDATVFLGERLRLSSEEIYGAARRSVVIPVGADGKHFRDYPPHPTLTNEPSTILYAGQFGRMHDHDTLATLLKEQGIPENMLLEFHAAGAGYDVIRTRIGESNARVAWGGPLGEKLWAETMRKAQVALITMAPGSEKVVMPSKTFSAMVAGQAILAICPRKSDLADLVIKHDCGWLVAPGDPLSLNRVMRRIGTHPEELLIKRRNAFEAGHRFYDQRPLAGQWITLIEELLDAKLSS